jgi:hypothetical protein
MLATSGVLLRRTQLFDIGHRRGSKAHWRAVSSRSDSTSMGLCIDGSRSSRSTQLPGTFAEARLIQNRPTAA